MDDVARTFLEKSRNLLAADYLPKIEKCLGELTTHDIWWRPNDRSNSIGNLILHLRGNVGMWILAGVGELPFDRNRQLEFDERTELSATELHRRLTEVTRQADEVLSRIDAQRLMSRRSIQGYDVTVLEAIYHVVEHFGMHTGQIILLAKARRGQNLRLWEPPADSRA